MLYVALAGQVVVVACAYWLEARMDRDARRSRVRTAVLWSGAWLLLGLLPTLWFGLFESGHAASSYAAVYLIERALSLDNVFVFAVLIAAFEIPPGDQDHLVSWGAGRSARFYEAVTPALTPEQRTKVADDLREHANESYEEGKP